MTKSEIITKFILYLDDMSELSSTEAEELFDKIYARVNAERPWEGTKTEYTGTQSTTLPYVALPTNFLSLTTNSNYTDSSGEYAGKPVVFIGSTYTPYPVVSWSDRRQYRNHSNVVWIDVGNSRLQFALQPTAANAIEYDYHRIMPVLINSESPWFPVPYQDVIYHGMCMDDFIIQQSDKAKSYQAEHKQEYKRYMEMMGWWNSQLVQI